MSVNKIISQGLKYPLPIGFALIITIMIFTSFYAVLQMKARSEIIIESVTQQNINNELLSTMSHAILGRSLIAIEMLHTDDPFRNDELFEELNELATSFAVAREKYEGQNLAPKLQKLLDTQGHLIKINGPMLIDMYELLLDDNPERALSLFVNVNMPRQKINLNIIKEMSDNQSWLSQDALEYSKEKNNSVLETIWIIISASLLVSILLSFGILHRQRKSDNKLAYQANTDTLTELPNRVNFIQNIDKYIAQDPKSLFAIVFFDIDYFKSINDNYGHEIGDEILRRFSAKIKSFIKPVDVLSRFGGDEFVLLLRSTHTEKETKEFVRELSSKLDTFFYINNKEIFISASIGVSIYAQTCPNGQKHCCENAKSLLKHADIAMYSAKQSGRNCFRFFSKETSLKMEREHTISHSLHTILKNHNSNNELSVMYQPLININNEEFTECEALIRWTNSEGIAIPPNEFIPIAEKSNLIEKINLFVLNQACKQQVEWQKMGIKDVRININLSGNKLIFKRLLNELENLIERLNLKPELFGIELTERTLFEISDETINTLDNVRKRGMKISIDDFGTGYSSLTYLKKLPITTLKIDKEFIAGLPNDMDDYALVKTIINLGHSLGLDIVAEGVETIEQLQFLKDHSCNIAQGYYFHKPLKSDQIPQLKLKLVA